MSRTIPFRRFQERKAKRKARRIWKMQLLNFPMETSKMDRLIGILAGCHSTPCSCFMCGNPRRQGELTIQEKQHLASMKEEIKQLGLAG